MPRCYFDIDTPAEKRRLSLAVTYVIQDGDSLWSIAQRFYGDGNQWNAIHEANRSTLGANLDFIQAGWTLSIPDLSTAPPPGQS